MESNNSNIEIEYKLIIEKEENTPSNIRFSSNVEPGKEYTSLKELFENTDFSGKIVSKENNKIEYRVFWKWPYESYLEDGSVDLEKDKQDTIIGQSNSSYIFYISVIAEQSRK